MSYYSDMTPQQIVAATRHLDEYTLNWMHRMGCKGWTVDVLANMTDRELLALPNIGPSRLNRLRKFFAELGFSQAPEGCPWCGK